MDGTTIVRTDCSGGGTFVLKQVQLASGSTRVVVAGHGVSNGRWKGSFSPDFANSGDETDLAATAVGHRFKTSVVVDDVTGDTNATMLRGSLRKTCAIGLEVTPRSTVISSPGIVLAVRHAQPRTLVTAGVVVGCHHESEWRYDISADYEDGGIGFGGGGLPCHREMVKIAKSTSTTEGFGKDAPGGLSLVARSHGDVRKISFETTAVR